MDNYQLSEQIKKKYASLKRHEANVERLRNKEPFTEFDSKKLHREKYWAKKIRKAISNIEEYKKNKNMITEDYVSFETAKLLKEKGFDGKCPNSYLDGVLFDASFNGEDFINAPTLQMAMKWLREVHNLFIFISTWLRNKDGTIQYYYEIRNLNDEDFETIAECAITEFDSYEKTCEAAIKYCLENLI